MDRKVADLLNQQVNKEFYSAYLYLDMANYYIDLDLDGFGNWYTIQAQEERDHAMLFVQYLQNNGEKLLLGNDEKAARTMSMFAGEEKIGNEIFIDSIRNVDIISNQTTGILFDNDALYLATT